jgi:hypothetical protein
VTPSGEASELRSFQREPRAQQAGALSIDTWKQLWSRFAWGPFVFGAVGIIFAPLCRQPANQLDGAQRGSPDLSGEPGLFNWKGRPVVCRAALALSLD